MLNMALTLARHPEVDLTLLTSSSELTGSGMLPKVHPLHGIPAIGLPWSREAREGCWLTLNRPLLDRYLSPDYWIYNSMETFVPTHKCKRIVTVHHIETSSERPFWRADIRRRLAAVRLRKAIRTADLIVAQSTFTARQVMLEHSVPEARIAVIGSGVEESLLARNRETVDDVQSSPYSPYVICIGAFQLRKGSDYLFNVARELQRRGSSLKIVCPLGLLGLPEFTHQVESLPNVVALGYINRDELLELIGGAVCMIIPSRLEGFGLTAIESMALGTPVVASNRSALPETLDGAGILVDPTDAVALADATERIFVDRAHRRNLVALGLSRAENFTWTRCVERLLAGIERIQTSVSPEADSSRFSWPARR